MSQKLDQLLKKADSILSGDRKEFDYEYKNIYYINNNEMNVSNDYVKTYSDLIRKNSNKIKPRPFLDQTLFKNTNSSSRKSDPAQTDILSFIKKKDPKEFTEEDDEKERKAYEESLKSKILKPPTAKYNTNKLYKNQKKVELIKKNIVNNLLQEKNSRLLNKNIEEKSEIKQINLEHIPNNETRKDKLGVGFLFEHLGKDYTDNTNNDEMKIINKNKKLQALLVSDNKISTPEEKMDIEININESLYVNISNEKVPSNTHINPYKFRTREEDFYRYFRFSREEILEKSLDFEFFKDKTKTNTGSEEHITIPDNFSSINHYKYVWVNNFFYELKHSLLSTKIEKSEIQKYKDINLKMSLSLKNIIYNTNIYVYYAAVNKNIDFARNKILKENDLFAIYLDENNIKSAKSTGNAGINLNCLTINNTKVENCNFTFDNKMNQPYFLGLINYEKNSNKDNMDLILKIHSKYHEKIIEGKHYSIHLLGNLTTHIREYYSIIDMENLELYEALLNSKLFINSNDNQCLDIINSEANSNNKTSKISIERTNNYLYKINNSNKFNDSQKEAINKCAKLRLKDIFLIQGPPGTGKTHTIIGLISLFYLQNPLSKILICAPSNAAIDEISLRIAKKGLLTENLNQFSANFIRFGMYDRLDKENKELNSEDGNFLQKYSIEKLIESKYMEKERITSDKLDKIKFQMEELESINEKIKKLLEESTKKPIKEFKIQGKTYSKLELLKKEKENIQLLKDYLNEKKNLKLEKKSNTNLKKLYERELFEKTRIVCTTLSSAGNEKIRSQNIDYEYLIIDEACQCVEPSCIIPYYLGVKKIVMVGDHMQLPATVFSDKATMTKYNRSFFERLIENNFPRHMLTIQYRMETNIREFIGRTFYHEKLQDDYNSISTIRNSSFYQIIDNKYNFSFFDLKYSKEKFLTGSKSYVNDKEISFIIHLLKKIQSEIKKFNFNAEKDSNFFNLHDSSSNSHQILLKFAIITPYKAQVRALKDEITSQCSEMLSFIEINTVDSFQGREQDIVIISTVRSNYTPNEKNIENDSRSTGIGFLNDYRRMNVALSRAKIACFIVGNVNTLIQNEYWYKLINHCKNKNSIFPIREDYLLNRDLIMNLLRQGKIVTKINKNDEIEEGEVNDTNINNFENYNQSNSLIKYENNFNQDFLNFGKLIEKYKLIFDKATDDLNSINIIPIIDRREKSDQDMLKRKKSRIEVVDNVNSIESIKPKRVITIDRDDKKKIVVIRK